MDEILHHFETMVSQFVGIYMGIESFQGFLCGAGFRPSTVSNPEGLLKGLPFPLSPPPCGPPKKGVEPPQWMGFFWFTFKTVQQGENRHCHAQVVPLQVARWLWVKTSGTIFGVGAPRTWVYFSGNRDVHCGYDLDFDPWPCQKLPGWTSTLLACFIF